MEVLRRQLPGDRVGAVPIQAHGDKSQGTGSRRDLLKATGAAIAGAAGVAALSTQTALATQGQPVIAGQNNTESAATVFDAQNNGGADIDGVQGFGSGLYSGVVGFGSAALAGHGVIGFGGGSLTGNFGPGVKGVAGGHGNPASESALPGVTGIGWTGVSGTGSIAGMEAFGKDGDPNGGDGIRGTGGTGSAYDGIGVTASSRYPLGSQLRLVPGADSPPPNAKAHYSGEIFMDGGCTLWVCTLTGVGTQTRWVRIGAVNPNFFNGAQSNTGGVMNFLPNPIRILDTRSDSPYAGGSTHAIQVTGASDINGSSTTVPAGAVGVIGNVTAVFPQGAGDLRLFPHGAALPATSNLNYLLNVTLANACIVALDGAGRLDIFVDVSTTHVIFDASGFVF